MGRCRHELVAAFVIVSALGCSRRAVDQSGAGGAGASGDAGRDGGGGSSDASGRGVGTGGVSGITGTGTSGSGGVVGAGGVSGTSGAGGPAGGAGSGDCTAGTETCATGLVCERYPPPACANPQWVAWPMPNGSDDVAAGAPNPMSFTDNGVGTVTDDVTRLMWQQAPPASGYLWAEARGYCADLVLAGHADWRLPSLVELISIADLGKANPAIDTTYFPATASVDYWSSTAWGTSPATAATVTFDRGNTRQQPMPAAHRLRCVR